MQASQSLCGLVQWWLVLALAYAAVGCWAYPPGETGTGIPDTPCTWTGL